MNKQQPEGTKFRDGLYRFMEEHSPQFWAVFSVFTVLVIYKTFNLAFLGQTPYTWDSTFHRLCISLLCIMMMREAYKGEFHLGFRTDGFLKGILLCFPAILFALFNLFNGLSAGHIYGESLFMLLITYGVVGLFEEVIMRGVLVGHMMHHWKDDPRRIVKTLLWSSVIFGVLHIGNVFSNPVNTIFQIFYATALGMAFAAAYIRTRNLWSCVLIHGMVDFLADMERIYIPLQVDMDSYQAALAQVRVLSKSIVTEDIEVLVFLAAILTLSIISIAASIYMLRGKKREEIDALWMHM